ncbi:MAG: acyl-CoA carboxylase epsilon subunit [Nitriliruptorales bacterium]
MSDSRSDSGSRQNTSELRIQVVDGGEPSPEELAALVIALTPVREEPSADRTRAARSGWRRAALLEGVGRTRYAGAPDVATGTRSLWGS